MSSYEAVRLYKGKRIIASKGDKQTHWCVLQLVLFCACGTLAGMIAGLLGLGGGFILGPLFLGLGIPPQVPSFNFAIKSMEIFIGNNSDFVILHKRLQVLHPLW